MNNQTKIDLAGLNSVQREAVLCTDGPSLIIAGAGSGKTKVLTYRIAYLLEQGVAPNEILALTFTNKASKEMKERISAMVGRDKSSRLLMGTFHSIFIRILRKYANKLGYSPTFSIYDTSDSRSAVRMCIKELELDEKTYKPNVVQSRISNAKNSLVTPNGYMNNATAIQNDRTAKMGSLCEIYARYSHKCKNSDAMDFDDILLNMNILLRDFPDICKTLGNEIKYILVDEYQDTNYAQYLIIKKLSYFHKNISVVGDDSQSIYGFRGARIENILNFKKDFPEAKVFRLEQNYRSTKTIVQAANSLISHNDNRLKKECFSEGDTGEKIEIIKAFTEQEEGSLVASSIAARLYRDKATYDQFAILYRTNAQSRIIEEMLRKRNLPYRIFAGHSFYERAEVRDMLAYFKLLVNQKDDEAFRRVVNVPARGIGETSIKYLSDAAASLNLSLWEASEREDVSKYGLKPAALKKMTDFRAMVSEVASKISFLDAYEAAKEIATKSRIISSLKEENTIESQARVENIEELLSSVNSFVEEKSEEIEEGNEALITLSDYLENVSLLSDLDIKEDKEDDANRISLMTVHSSKGLEFPHVYIVGMEENLFPSVNSTSRPDEVEEERRLFYVALTRAKSSISLSFARSRFKWGEYVNNRPSRFLKEIDSKYLASPIEETKPSAAPSLFTTNQNSWNSQRAAQRNSQRPSMPISTATRPTASRPIRPADPNFAPDPSNAIAQGQRVEHIRFGFGRVISIEGKGPDTKAKVDFEVGGVKTLLLKFAKLKIVAQ